MNIDFYISGEKVVLGSAKDIRFSFNRELTDLQNPEVRLGDFSYTISIPKCKQNNKIFKNLQEPHSIDKFNRVTNFDAELFADGRLILSGLYKISSISGSSYKGNLYSSSISWADDLSSYTLKDLDLSTDFNLGGGVADIQSYQNLGSDDTIITFPLTAYQPFPNSSALASKFTYDAGATLFTYKDFPPAVYYVRVLKACFDKIGFAASSELWQREDFKRLIMSYVGDEEYIFNYFQLHGVEATGLSSSLDLQLRPPYDGFFGLSDKIDGFFIGPNPSSDGIEQIKAIDIISKNTDNNAYNSAGEGEYNVTHNNKYNFRFNLKNFIFIKDQNNNTSGLEYKRFCIFAIDEAAIALDGSAIEEEIADYCSYVRDDIVNDNILFFADFNEGYSNIIGTTFNRFIEYTTFPSLLGSDVALYSATVWPSPPQDDFIITSGPIDLIKGQKIKFYFATFGRDSAPLPPSSIGWMSIFNYDSFELTVNNIYDTELNVAQNLPDINTKDFIADFIAATNSFFITDVERRIVNFFTFDNLHLNNEQAYDYNKANIEDANLLPNTTNRELTLAYIIGDKDRLVGGSSYGSRIEINPNIYSKGSKTISLLFSSTKYLKANHPAVSGGFLIPNIMSEEQFNQAPNQLVYSGGYNPRLLQKTGVLDLGSGPITVLIDGVSTDIVLTSFNGAPPHPTQAALANYNLRYDEEAGEQKNLFERFYREYLFLLNRSHILEIKGEVEVDDFREMQIEKPVLFDGEIWYILSITGFNPLSPNQATIKLIKKI